MAGCFVARFALRRLVKGTRRAVTREPLTQFCVGLVSNDGIDFMSFYPHEFEAPVEKLDFGKFAYTVLYIPESLIEELSLDHNPRQRIVAEIGDFEMDAAIQPSGNGWYVMLSKRVLKACGLKPDDMVADAVSGGGSLDGQRSRGAAGSA